MSKKHADSFASNIQCIVNAKIARRVADTRTAEWEESLPAGLQSKLVAKGVCEPRLATTAAATPASWTLLELMKHCRSKRTDLKDGTLEQILIDGKNLIACFGRELPISEIGVGDAKAFRFLLTAGKHRDKTDAKVQKPLAENTVRRRIGRAKQLFTHAIDFGVIKSNPFKEMPSSTRSNKNRQQFIEATEIEQVIAAAPRGDWRTILALSRYGGLRLPSKLGGLKWSDVSWASDEVDPFSTATVVPF